MNRKLDRKGKEDKIHIERTRNKRRQTSERDEYERPKDEKQITKDKQKRKKG